VLRPGAPCCCAACQPPPSDATAGGVTELPAGATPSAEPARLVMLGML
jgi:hypothetical protein